MTVGIYLVNIFTCIYIHITLSDDPSITITTSYYRCLVTVTIKPVLRVVILLFYVTLSNFLAKLVTARLIGVGSRNSDIEVNGENAD